MIGLVFTGPSVVALGQGRKTQTRRLHKRPRFKVGDRSYVKERIDLVDATSPALAVYAADGFRVWLDDWPWKKPTIYPLFMPAALRRYELTITDVREQRLQEISEADAMAEGVKVIPYNPEGDCWSTGQARTAFEFAWNELHGWCPNAWQTNPLVFAYTFAAEPREELRCDILEE